MVYVISHNAYPGYYFADYMGNLHQKDCTLGSTNRICGYLLFLRNFIPLPNPVKFSKNLGKIFTILVNVRDYNWDPKFVKFLWIQTFFDTLNPKFNTEILQKTHVVDVANFESEV